MHYLSTSYFEEVVAASGFITDYGSMGGKDNFMELGQLKITVRSLRRSRLRSGGWKEMLKSLDYAK